MKTVLFVDHIFHTKTKSFDFFVDILKKRFDVRKVFIDPSARFDPSTIDFDADYVIIAQVDLITPFFIARGRKVIVLQMFDGSNGLPDEHWVLNRQARYINFSQSLHARAIKLGCESLLVKYAPNPDNFLAVSDYKTLRCFFWNRLPESPINTKSVGQLLRGQLDTCHIHLPRDDGKEGDPMVRNDFDCNVSTSEWFNSRDAFNATVNACNVFVAPRLAEGIGHAFLDAMARGMIVIAWNYSTHTEYISNWHNGILIDNSVEFVILKNRTDLAQLGRQARVSITNDYANWIRDIEKINDFIETCPTSEAPNMPRCQYDIEKIIHAYRGGTERYTAELRKRALTVNMLSSWREYTRPVEQSITTHRASALVLLFGTGNAKYLQRSGFSTPEELFTWTIETTASLAFPNTLLPNLDGSMRLRIRLRSLKRIKVTIVVNELSAARIQVGTEWTDHEFVIAVEANTTPGETVIKIECDELGKPKNNDPRMLGVAIEQITIFSDLRHSVPAERDTSLQRRLHWVVDLLSFGRREAKHLSVIMKGGSV